MSIRVPSNKVFERQQKNLVPATYKKGIINSIYPQSWTADVQIVGNVQTLLKSIPLASHVNANFVKPGDKCRVDAFDESSPNDMVVAYIYGRKLPFASFNKGITTITTTKTTIAHGLGVTPDFVFFIPQATQQHADTASDPQGGTINYNNTKDIFQAQTADDTNIYLQSILDTLSVTWYVIKF